MSGRARSAITVLAVGGGVALGLAGLWRWRAKAERLVLVQAGSRTLMGTVSRLTAVTRSDRAGGARIIVRDAMTAIRDVESRMSVYLTSSALSRFNAAQAREPFALPADVLDVLKRAQAMAEATGGAFDPTCWPVIQLWRRAAAEGHEPADGEIAARMAWVGMDKIRLGPDAAVKSTSGVQVDLGGIAKGFAIDRATALLIAAELPGGQVDIGGDLRCFGRTHLGHPWPVKIQHPFAVAQGRTCGTMHLTDAAVATSGDYRRYVEIAGRRYSHIVDPRTGRPVQRRPSVTVVSLPAGAARPSAADADGWATALSVLGPGGLALIEQRPGLEALIVTGTPQAHQVHVTRGFAALLRPGTTIDLD